MSSVGRTQAQNSRSPTPAATKTAVSSSSPCGRISPKNSSARSCRIMIDPTTARFRMFCQSTSTTGAPSTPRAMQNAATQALLVHTFAAKCEAAACL